MTVEEGHVRADCEDRDRLTEGEGGHGRVKLNEGCMKKPYANSLFCNLI